MMWINVTNTISDKDRMRVQSDLRKMLESKFGIDMDLYGPASFWSNGVTALGTWRVLFPRRNDDGTINESGVAIKFTHVVVDKTGALTGWAKPQLVG